MVMFLKNKKIYIILINLLLALLIILSPSISINAVSKGIIICSNVIIPSLFPFTVCVLMIIKCNISIKNEFINKIIYKIFGLNFSMFFVFLISLIGGYPIGAKLINELYKQNKINEKMANLMLAYCVNAGPTFITSAIGLHVYKSKKIGVLMLLANIFSAILLSIICGKKAKQNYTKTNNNSINKFLTENIFTQSVSDSVECIINICGYVIIFSVLCTYLEYFFKNIPILKYVWLFVDVSNTINSYSNICVIAFLIGFSGLSVIFQVFSLSKNFKFDYLNFFIARIFHGFLNVIFTKLLLHIFNVNIATFSNNFNIKTRLLYSDITLFFSILIMLIVLITFIYTKNNCGKLLKDVI